MFEFVAKHKRLLQVVLIVMIVPPFAFWGIESYQRSFSSSTDVADVGGQAITEQELNEQVRQQQDRMRALLGRNYAPGMFDGPEMRAQLLEGMISQRLLMQQAVRGRHAVNNEQLRETIASIPAFQENGKFSKARYEEVLRSEGYSPLAFENSLRRDLMVQQVTSALGEASVVSKAAARRAAALRVERREFSEHLVTAEMFVSKVSVTPEAIKAHYEANRARFEVPERARVEYVVLNAEALSAAETVSAQDVKAWYEANLDRQQEKEQRQASHILISVKAGAPAADREKAREKAASLLAQARKAPATFSELAKKNSDDPGSAGKGGDLGYFSRGMMVKAFEDAVFALKPNDMAGPVESEFGFHVIRLTGVKAGKTRSLDEMRPEIERELKKQRSGKRFAEAAEAFSNLVYEQADSLKPVADKYRIPIQASDGVTRKSAPLPMLNNPKLLAAIFGDEAVKNRRNTEAVEVAPGTLVSARVVEHTPAALRPLEEVKAEIIRQVTQAEAARLAQVEGARRIEALRKGETAGVQFGPGKSISREDSKGVPPQVAAAVFRADRAKLPAYGGVATPNGYVLVRLNKVIEGEVDAAREKAMQVELGRTQGAREFQAYLAGMRAGTKISINRALLDKQQ